MRFASPLRPNVSRSRSAPATRTACCCSPRLTASGVALTERALLRAVLAYPLLTLKVVGAIHWHALRMVLKGFRLRSRPNPPPIPVTVVNVEGQLQ